MIQKMNQSIQVFRDAIPTTTAIRRKQNKPPNSDQYKVLSSEEIVKYVCDYVQEVNSVLQLTSTVTRLLLAYCKWDKALLMENFYSDPDKLFKDARVVNPFVLITADESETNECEICYAELSSGTAQYTNACGHRFCTPCWSEYLKVKIMDEGVGNSIPCAANDCDVIIDDETVNELVGDSEAKRRYQHLITNCFVQQNLLLRWCPARGCSFAVQFEYRPFKPILCHCKCGHDFCFDCVEEWHGPIPCDLLKRFKMHFRDTLNSQLSKLDKLDARKLDESDRPIDEIKTCPNPNCAVSIQKISGCNKIKCKSCSTIFCWWCMERFNTQNSLYGHFCKDKRRVTNTEVFSGFGPPRKRARFIQSRQQGSTVSLVNGQKSVVTVADEESENNETLEQDQVVKEQIEDGNAAQLPFVVNVNRDTDRPIENTYYNKYLMEDVNFTAAVAQSAQTKETLKRFYDEREKVAQLESALIVLAQSHRTLKYSAIFAMYLKNVDKSMLFESLYLDFQETVTVLSNAIEIVNKKVLESPDSIPEFMNLLPLYRSCELRQRALIDYIDEGYDNEWWFFQDIPKDYK